MKLDWYYKIWVDAITTLRAVPANKKVWKFYAMISISMAMALNLLLIMAIFQKYILQISFDNLQINIFHNQAADTFFTFFTFFLLLPLIINYFLIFRNNRYNQLITKYKYYNGKLFLSYSIISYFLPPVLLMIVGRLS